MFKTVTRFVPLIHHHPARPPRPQACFHEIYPREEVLRALYRIYGSMAAIDNLFNVLRTLWRQIPAHICMPSIARQLYSRTNRFVSILFLFFCLVLPPFLFLKLFIC